MKIFGKFLTMMFLAGLMLGVSTQVHALVIYPDDAILTGNQTSQSQINAAIKLYLGSMPDELYKQNVGDPEDEGPLGSSYQTSFFNTPTDPSDALVEYVGGPYIGPTAYALVKDGNQIPAWYFFDLTALGWNGTDDLDFQDFWPSSGAISHVTLYGTTTTVPEPSTLLLLGSGLIGLVIYGRKRS